jgi:hypothetical protein
MRPFCTREIAVYLLWVAILLMAVAIVAWLVFFSPGHEPLNSHHQGAVVLLQMPNVTTLLRG